jgi:RNA polymerase sigma-70 factor (ECF subfamily)
VTKSTDEELLLASGRGDRGAFALLVERHQRAVIQFVHRFLATADRATAEDLAQQVFLNAWRYAPTFEPRAKVLTWLFRIASNACLNYRRREQSRISAVALDESTGRESDRAEAEGVELRLVEEERAREVRAAVAALPPSQRVAIVLRYFHEFSHADIAAVMETSLSAVDSLLHRGRRSLHARLVVGEKADSPQVSRSRRAESI